jgi:uncharacterized repeat protein (TIGR01451 family)
VKCWGANDFGQIGNGKKTDHYTGQGYALVPTQVIGLTSGVTAVAAGPASTCALIGTTNVKCWGSGNLGDDSGNSSLVPVDVKGLDGAFVSSADLSVSLTTVGTKDTGASFNVSVSNAGANVAADTTLTLQLPPGITFYSGSTSGGIYCSATGATVTCPLGGIGTGSGASASISVNVADYGSYSTTASVASPTADPNISNNTVTVVSNFAAPPPPIPGQADVPTLPEWAAIIFGILLVYGVAKTNGRMPI